MIEAQAIDLDLNATKTMELGWWGWWKLTINKIDNDKPFAMIVRADVLTLFEIGEEYAVYRYMLPVTREILRARKVNKESK